jgi:hypothetical protein
LITSATASETLDSLVDFVSIFSAAIEGQFKATQSDPVPTDFAMGALLPRRVLSGSAGQLITISIGIIAAWTFVTHIRTPLRHQTSPAFPIARMLPFVAVDDGLFTALGNNWQIDNVKLPT